MVTEHRGRLMKKSIWGGRNKRGIEDRRMSHSIAPKGHQNQEDKENVRKGYRIVLAYSNGKERSFDSNATYTDRQRNSTLGLGSFCARTDFFFLPHPLLAVFFVLLEEVCFLFGPFAFATGYCTWKAFKCEQHPLIFSITKVEQKTKVWVGEA